AKVERVGEGIQVTFDSGLLFDFDSDAIRADAGRNLVELARSLNKYPDSNLLIVGHTDSKGEDAYNQSLSYRRANSAASYVQRQGVARQLWPHSLARERVALEQGSRPMGAERTSQLHRMIPMRVAS